jgi:hypothetical protein
LDNGAAELIHAQDHRAGIKGLGIAHGEMKLVGGPLKKPVFPPTNGFDILKLKGANNGFDQEITNAP